MAYTVQQLHRQDHIMFFRQRHQTFQSFLTVFPSLKVSQSIPLSGEADQIRQSGCCHLGNYRFITGNQFVVQFRIVKSTVNTQTGSLAHSDSQSVLLYNRPVLRVEQFDRFDSYIFTYSAKFFQRIVTETPFTDGMAYIPFQRFFRFCFFLFSGICCFQIRLMQHHLPTRS